MKCTDVLKPIEVDDPLETCAVNARYLYFTGFDMDYSYSFVARGSSGCGTEQVQR